MRSLLYSTLVIPVLLAGCQSDSNQYQHQQVVAQVVQPDSYNVSAEPGTAYISRSHENSECAVPAPQRECVTPAPPRANGNPKKVDFGDSDISWNDGDSIYGHAKNYSWLMGNLQRVHVTGATWKIRFAALDEEDRYGGTAILTPDARIDQFQDGDFVYIEGHILNDRPSVYLAGPSYRIRSIRKVTNSDRRKLWSVKNNTDKAIR